MKEEKKSYFKAALSDFAYDVAAGAQIRHLADLGYTTNQILAALDFAVPYRKVQETLTQYLQETGMLVLGKPDHPAFAKPKFVREYDSYGRASFRQVAVKKEWDPGICWQKCFFAPATGKELLSFLKRKTEENGEEMSYISCDFGLDEDGNAREALMPRQQEYIEGILWDKTRMYHRLTPRMQEIAVRLYEKGLYEGEAYFKETKEHFVLASRS